MEPITGTGSDLRSDAELIAASREGDAGAFGALYERHAGAALVVARQYVSGTAEAEDAVADAFAAVWSALRGGSGPTDAFRAYLYTVVRRVAAVQREKGRRAEPTDDVAVLESGAIAEAGAEEPALAGFERSVVARAFAALPERWQAVLWHSEVEGLTPAEIAPLLGLSANSTAALAYRAREGLRQAYLTQHLADPLDDGCRAVSGKLGGYVRGGLGQRDTAQVEAHLDGCGTCRGLVLELQDVNHGLRGIVAPLVLGTAGLGALAYGLPTSGGLAAGAASLTSGGTGAGAGAAGGAAAGAAGGAAGTGAGAAAAGIGAAGAVGTGVAVGAAGASGGAVAGGFLGALAGALGVPAALVAAVAGVVGVVVVGGVAFGVTQLASSGDDEAAPGAVVSTAPSTSPPLGETGGGSADGASDGPTAAPEGVVDVPESGSTAADDELPGSGAGGAAGGASGSGGGASSAGDPSSPTVPDPLPTSVPTGTPTPPATRPAAIELSVPGGTLAAGQTGQMLSLGITNTGEEPATSLQAVVELPDGITAGPQVTALAGRFAVRAAGEWACAVTDGDVRCTLPVLAGGASTRVNVTVDVDESFDVPSGSVAWQVTAAGIDAVRHQAAVPVTPAPARLVLDAPPDLTFEHRRTTTVGLPVRNAGGVDAKAAVRVEVPAGLTVTGGSSVWTCTAAAGGLDCEAASIPARTTSSLPLQVHASATADSGTLKVTLSPGAAGGLSYTVLEPEGHGYRYEGVGSLGVVEVGAPLMGCQASTRLHCWSGTGNNNDVEMRPVSVADGSDGTERVSSSSALALPAGATVEYAALYWSANRDAKDEWVGDLAAARLRGPGGDYATVGADETWRVTDNAGREYYQSFADVTGQVAAAGAGTWSVADIALSAGGRDSYYAGWALVVVYSQPAAPRASVTLYDGATWAATNSSETVAVPAGSGQKVRVGVVAWEGDRATSGDTLKLDGVALTPWREDETGSSGNAFDSSAYGFGYANSLGVDVKGFGEVTAIGDDAVLTAATGGDQYLLGAVTVRVTD